MSHLGEKNTRPGVPNINDLDRSLKSLMCVKTLKFLSYENIWSQSKQSGPNRERCCPSAHLHNWLSVLRKFAPHADFFTPLAS